MSDDEAGTLRDFLRDHLREMRLEIARTDRRAFRHSLVERLEVIERVLLELERTCGERFDVPGPPCPN